MNVIIWEKAKREIDFAYVWCAEYFGLLVADRFLDRIRHGIEQVASFPYMGLKEPLLRDKPRLYRSLFIRPYGRLVYYVDEIRSEVHIVDYWDTRRAPASLTECFTEE